MGSQSEGPRMSYSLAIVKDHIGRALKPLENLD